MRRDGAYWMHEEDMLLDPPIADREYRDLPVAESAGLDPNG
jgi:hypothetical protein